MPRIVFHHAKCFDLVNDQSSDEQALQSLTAAQRKAAQRDDRVLHNGEVYEPSGQFPVASLASGQVEMRHRIAIDSPRTESQILDGWTPDPAELAAYVTSVLERNVPAESITAVSGDDEALTARIAGLLGVPVVAEETA